MVKSCVSISILPYLSYTIMQSLTVGKGKYLESLKVLYPLVQRRKVSILSREKAEEVTCN